ncbi:hypothetical protein [Actinoalloteichus sp. GBA129-24]|uniref:hypothetical protein n=1 Tax=Actinoalloteichus sp. GBA129-24 TaxID=1612551 RepID=UPI000950539E|nr:hypothetical protein [Actinoalloteichus sp. GBA129-24]APU19289.1 hypothetical protein UA75_06330 [Actinoalloteichus sp. GBA129-24]
MDRPDRREVVTAVSLIPRTTPGAVPEHNREALQQRWDRIRPMLLLGLLVLPAGQLVVFVGIFLDHLGPRGAATALLPGVPLAIVLTQLIRNRLLLSPSEWRSSTVLTGVFTVPFLAFPVFGGDPVDYLAGFRGALVVIAVLLPVVCLILVVRAGRILIESPATVVGASDFQLVHRIRCRRWSADVTLDEGLLRWQALRGSLSKRNHRRQIDVEGSLPLTEVLDTGVRIVRDTDRGRVWMRGRFESLRCPAGAALVLHTGDGEWLLPITEADKLGPILLARANHLRATAASGDPAVPGRPPEQLA